MNLPLEPITPYPEIEALLAAVLSGAGFTAMLLDGSLVNGGFDAVSDVDFMVAAEDEFPEETFQALKALHNRLAQLPTPWAIQLEGSCLSSAGLRRYDPDRTRYPIIERGAGESLKWAAHGQAWYVHRWLLREKSRPATLWGVSLLEDPAQITHRGYQC